MSLSGTTTPPPNGNGNRQAAGVNLAFTKFLYVIARHDDDAARTRMRAVGSVVARGFSNDFGADGGGAVQPFETVQFLVRDGDDLPPAGVRVGPSSLADARYVVQVCSKYRPRLDEIESELRRRLGDSVEVGAIDGAVRHPRYSSAEMQHYVQTHAPPRQSGRLARNAIIVPVRKTADWWSQEPLDRHAFFYPHLNPETGCPARGHARSGAEGIPHLFRRVYHNPDGYDRAGEFDFVAYFECEDPGVPVFDRVLDSMRDPDHNPEWRYVEEGPVWKGKRVLKW